jgi:hypothetical protein
MRMSYQLQTKKNSAFAEFSNTDSPRIGTTVYSDGNSDINSLPGTPAYQRELMNRMRPQRATAFDPYRRSILPVRQNDYVSSDRGNKAPGKLVMPGNTDQSIMQRAYKRAEDHHSALVGGNSKKPAAEKKHNKKAPAAAAKKKAPSGKKAPKAAPGTKKTKVTKCTK